MPTRLEDEIRRQLDESKPIEIDKEGRLIPSNNKSSGAGDSAINPVTGEPATRLKPQRWFSWFNDNPGRLLQEKQAMSMRFPNLYLAETSNGLTWTGYLHPEGIRSYRISLIYSSDFPYSPPKVWIIDPKVTSPKHQFGDGHLCLMHPSDGTWQTNTTAVTLIAMTATWLWCYEYHQRHCGCSQVPCKHWPGKEA